MANDNEKKQPRQDQDLPGYPHYPSEEDIMNPKHGYKKIAADEELANSARLSRNAVERQANTDENIEPADDDDIKIVRGTEADVTREDLEILGDRNADQDMNDDELTGNARVDDTDEEQDLDIPGSELDDSEENIGEEDEEN